MDQFFESFGTIVGHIGLQQFVCIVTLFWSCLSFGGKEATSGKSVNIFMYTFMYNVPLTLSLLCRSLYPYE